MIRPHSDVPYSLRAAAYLVITTIIIYFMWAASNLLIPLAFGALFALLLYPLCQFLENNGFPRVLAITVSLIAVVVLISGIVVLLSTQIMSFADELPLILQRINEIVEDLEWWLFKNFNIQLNTSQNFMKSSLESFMNSGVVLLSGTITTFMRVAEFVGLVPVYMFLFLLYRNAFEDFILYVSPVEQHRAVKRILIQVQKVVQNYVIGIFTVMSIVAVLNSISLFIIGVDYAIFFGFLAALLTIIPYIGIFIGSLLPAMYALLTKDSALYPLLVIAMFGFVQFMEGNFITPRITGGRVKVNALAAIIALVAGGYLWGAAGLIIFMPFVAILKVVFDNIEETKALGMLLGTEIYEGDKRLKLSSFLQRNYLKIAKSRKRK